MNSGIVAIIIVVIVIGLYISNLLPYAVTALLACVAMVVFQVVPFSTAFAGFGSDTVMLVAGMMVMGHALFETGAARLLGKMLTRFCGKSERLFLAICLIFTTILTAFCSNTATIMLMMAVVSAAARVNPKITKKNCVMALGFAAVSGGSLTMVGSTPQLAVQGILESSGIRTIGLFDMVAAGLPRMIMLIIYFTTIGYQLQKKVFRFDEIVDESESGENSETEYPPKWKAFLALGILAVCIASFVLQKLSVGTTSLIGALLCILTGCISWKRTIKVLDWSSLVLVGSAIGFATGLDKSGGGAMIAGFIVNLLGDHISFIVLLAVFLMLSTVLANIMSHTATCSILVPIAVALTAQLGYDSTLIAIAIIQGAAMASVTPVSTAPITMTMRAGYRFSDYVKVGGLMNVISYIITIGSLFIMARVV